MNAPLGAVKVRIRPLLVRSRDRAVAPLLARIDAMEASVNARLDDLAVRLRRLETAVETLDGRTASVAERAEVHGESEERLRLRLEHVEELLGSHPGGSAAGG